MEDFKTLEELSKILNIKAPTIRSYLGNYRFSKFFFKIRVYNKPRGVFKFNSDFVKQLANFLYIKKQRGAIRLLGEYCGINAFKLIENDEEEYYA